jgi:hypothetical protein
MRFVIEFLAVLLFFVIIVVIAIIEPDFIDKRYIKYTDNNKEYLTQEGQCVGTYYFVGDTQVFNLEKNPIECEYTVVKGKKFKDFNTSYYVEMVKKKFNE